MKYVSPKFDISKPAARFNYESIPCPAQCNKSENLVRLRGISDIKKGQLNWRLTGSDMHKLIRPAMKELVEIINSDKPAAFWYIHGPNGIGKSYILIAAINEAMINQRSGLYTTTTKLLDALRNTHSDVAAFGTEHDLLEKVRRSTILAIDEVGRERSTEYAEEKLFDIYNSRYLDAHVYGSNNEAKITLLAGNFPPKELEPYLQSRLQDKNSRVIDMSVKDKDGLYIHPDRRPVE
jgi:DNA replication protein DnaC